MSAKIKMTYMMLKRVPYITWKKNCMAPTLIATAPSSSHRKQFQLSKPETEFHVKEEMYLALLMHRCGENTACLEKMTKLSHLEVKWGGREG